MCCATQQDCYQHLTPCVGLCCCSAASIAPISLLMDHVLATLPDSDQAAVVGAGANRRPWRLKLHSDPMFNPASPVPLAGMVLLLRSTCLCAYQSHLTCVTMLEQLAGSRALADWGSLENVGFVYVYMRACLYAHVRAIADQGGASRPHRMDLQRGLQKQFLLQTLKASVPLYH